MSTTYNASLINIDRHGICQHAHK